MSTSEIKGISGWLTLVAIGLVVSPFRFYLTTLSVYPDLFENGTWYLLTDPKSSEYIKGFSSILYSEISFNLFLFSSLIYLNFLFFYKRKTFPKAYIAITLIGLLYIPVNAFLANAFFPQMSFFDGETLKNFVVTLISAVIWVPYMLKSRRVKNTFIEEHSVRNAVLSTFVLSCISLASYSLYLQKITFVPEVLTIEDKLVQVANEANRDLPKMLDAETKLDAVYTESNNLQYRYSLVNYSATDIDVNALQQNIRPNLVKSACTNSATVGFMQEGVSVSYTYFDKLGSRITSIDITYSDCV
ncbi:DUF2569 domain-containing protein [Vibrio splendidus]